MRTVDVNAQLFVREVRFARLDVMICILVDFISDFDGFTNVFNLNSFGVHSLKFGLSWVSNQAISVRHVSLQATVTYECNKLEKNKLHLLFDLTMQVG